MIPFSAEEPEVVRRGLEVLAPMVTEARFGRMKDVAVKRTRHLTVVLEDLYQPHNGSAVLRSCDAMGVLDVHIVEQRNTYRTNPDVELGTAQWLRLQRYRSTIEAYSTLRSEGYRIVGTTPHDPTITLDEIAVADSPVAVVFGNELDGLSPEALAGADERMVIPMLGFVESFNISVSAAIVLYTLRRRLDGVAGVTLSPAESDALVFSWLRRDVAGSDVILRERAADLFGDEAVGQR